ncbi:Fe-S cluster assembly protein HesB [Microbacterium horticulturae]|uniref:Fe-S cluster assembly protein HesB n=1 Tax=Microbacterium horticulturae TaxID=3028316 RepID=A0ABY8C0A7_9MICO|nr:Fe-S cluster assembly protein HesB [Microbacterium sp. KACC 23027]WEG09884.1 Fe-S cluster assembly protein HesB [Microbacterium sp. KACC 23027]
MLTMTENAQTAVKSIVSNGPEAETAGLRIHGGDNPSSGFALSVVTAPDAADTVVDEAGARVFLDEGAAAALDDQVLDAQVDDAGGVRFGLTAQV